MTLTDMRTKATVDYKKAVWSMAKRLEAEEVTIWNDWSVSMFCKDGCICDRYKPSAKELRR